MIFGPKNKREREIFAIEGLRVNVQQELHKLMLRNNVSQKQLAQRLGVSEARVSQFFAPQCNLTIAGLARAFHALGDGCVVVAASQLSPQRFLCVPRSKKPTTTDVKASRRYLSLIETPADARYEEPDKEPANPEPQVSVA